MGNRQGDARELGAHTADGPRRGGRASLCRARVGNCAMSFGRTFKALTKSNDRRFVSLLSPQAELTVRALQVLEKFGPQAADNTELVDQLKEIEREGDAARRILIDELLHTYATPFDREDLFGLSRAIDDILDG